MISFPCIDIPWESEDLRLLGFCSQKLPTLYIDAIDRVYRWVIFWLQVMLSYMQG
jgi:hypothetical protein